MKKGSRLIALLMSAALMLSLAACGDKGNNGGTSGQGSNGGASNGASNSDEMLGSASATVRFKVGTTTAPDGHYVQGLQEMQKLLEEYSNGEMTLDIYPNSALGGESDMMDSV